MKKFTLACSLIILFSAQTASAAVLFNEIAWMGTASSSADEWIELYNSGDSTEDLMGWKITGKGGAQIVALKGLIAPHGYFLIERSDDSTVPAVMADLVTAFTKGIANDGETLKILDGVGTVVDTVVGGKNWSKVGGDNSSKETAQRTSSGWITASPTPKAVNVTPSLAKEVAPVFEPKNIAKPEIVTVAHANTISPTPVQQKPNTQHIDSTDHSVVNLLPTPTTTISANVLWQRGRDAEAEKHAWAWMIFAVALVIIASIVILRANIYQPTEADKYAIIEDVMEEKKEEEEDRLRDY